MQTKLRGIRGGGSGEPVDVKVSRAGSLHIAQMLPPGALLTAMGKSYTAITTTAVVGSADEPDTTAAFTLWNGEADGGLSYVIERIFCWEDASTSDTERFSLWACVHPVGMTAVGVEITLRNNLRGVTSYGGEAHTGTGDTVVNDGWSPWGSSVDNSTGAGRGGACIVANVNGRMIIPPSAACSLYVVSTSSTPTYTCGFHWHEVQLDLA